MPIGKNELIQANISQITFDPNIMQDADRNGKADIFDSALATAQRNADEFVVSDSGQAKTEIKIVANRDGWLVRLEMAKLKSGTEVIKKADYLFGTLSEDILTIAKQNPAYASGAQFVLNLSQVPDPVAAQVDAQATPKASREEKRSKKQQQTATRTVDTKREESKPAPTHNANNDDSATHSAKPSATAAAKKSNPTPAPAAPSATTPTAITPSATAPSATAESQTTMSEIFTQHSHTAMGKIGGESLIVNAPKGVSITEVFLNAQPVTGFHVANNQLTIPTPKLTEADQSVPKTYLIRFSDGSSAISKRIVVDPAMYDMMTAPMPDLSSNNLAEVLAATENSPAATPSSREPMGLRPSLPSREYLTADMTEVTIPTLSGGASVIDFAPPELHIVRPEEHEEAEHAQLDVPTDTMMTYLKSVYPSRALTIYDRYLKSNSALSGRIEIEMVVDHTTGAVKSANVVENTTGNTDFATELATTARRLTLPVPKSSNGDDAINAQDFVINYPLIFSSKN